MKPDRSTLIQESIRLLQAIAPELDADMLSAERPLRQQLDLDSMDWLNFLVSLHQRFQVEFPESDYSQLRSLNNVADYLSARLA